MNWESHLGSLERHLLSLLDEFDRTQLLETRETLQLLHSPASTAELIGKEDELGFSLPQDMREFFLTSNGMCAAYGFPVGIAPILAVGDLYVLEDHRMCGPDYFENLKPTFKEFEILGDRPFEHVVVFADLDGNELAMTVRQDHCDKWPVLIYDPDGGHCEQFENFTALMVAGLTW